MNLSFFLFLCRRRRNSGKSLEERNIGGKAARESIDVFSLHQRRQRFK